MAILKLKYAFVSLPDVLGDWLELPLGRKGDDNNPFGKGFVGGSMLLCGAVLALSLLIANCKDAPN